MKESARRAFLDNIFDNSLDAIIFTDEKGYISEANKAFMELTGYNKEEIIGKHTAEFSPMKEGTYECTTGELIQIDKKFSDDIQSTMRTFMEGNNLRNVMGFQLRKDGKIVPVEDNMVFLLGGNGEKIGAFAVIRDITERKKADREINEAKEFLESVIENSRDGIVITDAKGHILSANSALVAMCTFSKEELIGKHSSIFTIEDRVLKEHILDQMEK